MEEDLKETDRRVGVEDQGTTKTHSISHFNANAGRAREPTVAAVVALDGASEGMIFHT